MSLHKKFAQNVDEQNYQLFCCESVRNFEPKILIKLKGVHLTNFEKKILIES